MPQSTFIASPKNVAVKEVTVKRKVYHGPGGSTVVVTTTIVWDDGSTTVDSAIEIYD